VLVLECSAQAGDCLATHLPRPDSYKGFLEDHVLGSTCCKAAIPEECPTGLGSSLESREKLCPLPTPVLGHFFGTMGTHTISICGRATLASDSGLRIETEESGEPPRWYQLLTCSGQGDTSTLSANQGATEGSGWTCPALQTSEA
jgi:hypothetical protein